MPMPGRKGSPVFERKRIPPWRSLRHKAIMPGVTLTDAKRMPTSKADYVPGKRMPTAARLPAETGPVDARTRCKSSRLRLLATRHQELGTTEIQLIVWSRHFQTTGCSSVHRARTKPKGWMAMRIKPKDRTQWQRWFAWHPVIINNVTVWLEIVERKRDPDIFDWVYSYRVIDRSNRRRYFHLRWFPGRRRLRDGWKSR
jgi:hypothetical protein